MRCDGRTSYGHGCGTPAAFAAWYEGLSESALAACGRHLAQICRRMIADATQTTGRFVKVTTLGGSP